MIVLHVPCEDSKQKVQQDAAALAVCSRAQQAQLLLNPAVCPFRPTPCCTAATWSSWRLNSPCWPARPTTSISAPAGEAPSGCFRLCRGSLPPKSYPLLMCFLWRGMQHSLRNDPQQRRNNWFHQGTRAEGGQRQTRTSASGESDSEAVQGSCGGACREKGGRVLYRHAGKKFNIVGFYTVYQDIFNYLVQVCKLFKCNLKSTTTLQIPPCYYSLYKAKSKWKAVFGKLSAHLLLPQGLGYYQLYKNRSFSSLLLWCIQGCVY